MTSNGGSCSQSSIALWLHPTRVNGCFHLSERRFVLARMTTRRRPQQQWARSALASSQGHHDQGTSAGDVQGEVCGPAYNSNGYQGSARACPAPSSLLPHCLVAGSAYVPRRRAMAMSKVKGGWTSRHEPAGLPGLPIERFPSDFRPTSLGRVVLPMKGGKPYVAEDGLPNPLLSTLNAIKYLSSRDADDKDARWNAQALSQFQPTTWALPMRRSSPTMPSGPVSTRSCVCDQNIAVETLGHDSG